MELEHISKGQVQILDHLRPTATGLDGLPAWFLRLEAPVFCQPTARLFNLSIATSTVPPQWKQASIIPIGLPKTLPPKQHADFRPISITQVLTRIMEKTVVRHFLYPTFLAPLSPSKPVVKSTEDILQADLSYEHLKRQLKGHLFRDHGAL